MTTLWLHQTRGLAATYDAIRRGIRRILFTCPTGGGKSRCMIELILEHAQRGVAVAVFTHRRMLLEQISRVLGEHGIDHSIRCAGYDHDESKAVQLCSTASEFQRVFNSLRWSAFPAQLLLIDEAHAQKGVMMTSIIQYSERHNATVIGFTATPTELGGHYDELIVAGVNSELRECGALVPCYTYAPDEPDLAFIKRVKVPGCDSEDGSAKIDARRSLQYVQQVHARILSEWLRLCETRSHTICFAPDVPASLWLAQEFTKAGHRAAHIDSGQIWIDGESYKPEQDIRDSLVKQLDDGSLKILTNRFVLREGIDIPSIRHVLYATVVSSLSSYIQSGGRGLRAAPGKERCVIQDHGGNWWRHGSLNEDRVWQLDDEDRIITATRHRDMREGVRLEPVVCPDCHGVFYPKPGSGFVCPRCAGKFSRNHWRRKRRSTGAREMQIAHGIYSSHGLV